MSNLIYVIFENEEKAYEGATVLRGLDRDGAISVSASAIVARRHDGSIRIREDGNNRPIGTALGILTGAIAGTVGGPAGVIAGGTVGGLVGSGVDIFNLAIGDAFADEVSSELEPGEVAIVAEIEESWISPLDAELAALGVDVVRRSRFLFEDEQFERDAAAARVEYRELKNELAVTHADNKAAVQAKLDAARERLEDASQKAEARHQQAVQDGQARVDALLEQARTANDERRAEIEAKITDVRERNAERREKLGAAWELTKEALAA